MKARYLLFALAIAMPAGAVQNPEPRPPVPQNTSAQTPELKDRVMAVVDEDPILASELERVIALGLVQPREGEGDVQFRRRILNGLVEERLRFHEIDRFGFEQVPVDMIEKNVAQIRAVLKEQRLNEELAKWTEELRRAADIHVYFDKPADQLPPVVKRIGKKDEFQ